MFSIWKTRFSFSHFFLLRRIQLSPFCFGCYPYFLNTFSYFHFWLILLLLLNSALIFLLIFAPKTMFSLLSNLYPLMPQLTPLRQHNAIMSCPNTTPHYAILTFPSMTCFKHLDICLYPFIPSLVYPVAMRAGYDIILSECHVTKWMGQDSNLQCF